MCVRTAFHLMIFENGLWHMEAQRTQRWIILAAYHISLPCFFFFLFTWQNISHPRRLSPSSYSLISEFHFLSASICFGWLMRGETESESGRVVHFLWACECGAIICFSEGVVVQRQPAAEACLLYLIGTESVTLIKNPEKAP